MSQAVLYDLDVCFGFGFCLGFWFLPWVLVFALGFGFCLGFWFLPWIFALGIGKQERRATASLLAIVDHVIAGSEAKSPTVGNALIIELFQNLGHWQGERLGEKGQLIY
jgi:hypothetical protein